MATMTPAADLTAASPYAFAVQVRDPTPHFLPDSENAAQTQATQPQWGHLVRHEGCPPHATICAQLAVHTIVLLRWFVRTPPPPQSARLRE